MHNVFGSVISYSQSLMKSLPENQAKIIKDPRNLREIKAQYLKTLIIMWLRSSQNNYFRIDRSLPILIINLQKIELKNLRVNL